MDEEIGFNPSGRRLCPDGSCIGLLDAAGRCGECGRLFGVDTSAVAAGAGAVDVGATRSTGVGAKATPGGSGSTGAGDAGFDPNRRLCDDGACVGVVQSDGTCNVCGRVARS